MDDPHSPRGVHPLGLTEARIRYLRSPQGFLSGRPAEAPLTLPAGEFTAEFAVHVSGASFKIAQCAALYERGYHCGIIPVDSGMVLLLAPLLGIRLDTAATNHEGTHDGNGDGNRKHPSALVQHRRPRWMSDHGVRIPLINSSGIQLSTVRLGTLALPIATATTTVLPSVADPAMNVSASCLRFQQILALE